MAEIIPINWVTELEKRTNLQTSDRVLIGITSNGVSVYTTVGELMQMASSATVINRGDWVSGTTYHQGDFVFAESTAEVGVNSMYFLIGESDYVSNTEPNTDLTHWSELTALKGDTGAKGDKGDKGDPLTWDDLTPAQKDSLKGIQGDSGWTALERIVIDGVNLDSEGQTRDVKEIYDWFGGEGIKPALTGYVGASGIVADIANGTNLRGSRGAVGATGEQGEQGIQGEQGEQGEKGDKPSHEWSGTDLRFENPDGSWGSYVDLLGPEGPQGEQGEVGEGLHFDASGPLSGRSAYDSEDPNFVYLADDEGKFYVRLNPTGWSIGQDVSGGLQTLSQPSIGQLAISSGNTVDLNTVNTSGNQTGIAGNKTTTGVWTFLSSPILNSSGTTTQTLIFSSDGNNDWTIQKTGSNKSLIFNRYIGGVLQGIAFSINNTSGTVTIPNLSGTGNGIVGVNASGTLTRNNPSDLGFVPYTGATQGMDFNTQNFRIGGNFNKSFSTFERSHLGPNETGVLHFTRLTNVASLSIGNDTSTPRDCIVISIPITGSTKWIADVDIFSGSSSGGIFPIDKPLTIQLSAYGTSNSNRSVSVKGAVDAVASVSFGRNLANDRAIIIIRPSNLPSTPYFSYGKVNISNFYHGVTYSPELAVKTNYSVTSILESDLTDFTLSGEVTNAEFARDPYYLDYNNLVNTPTIGNGALTLATGTGLSGAASFSANQAGAATFTVGVAGTHKLPTTSEWSSKAEIGTGAAQVRSNTDLDARYIQSQRYKAVTSVTANKTIALVDEDSLWIVSGTRTLTVPTNATVAFPIGGRIDVQVNASDTANIEGDSGVTLTHKDGTGNTSREGFTMFTFIKTGTNAWTIIGG